MSSELSDALPEGSGDDLLGRSATSSERDFARLEVDSDPREAGYDSKNSEAG